jgi:Transglutaminase-like enzymes, putative cysteine proteases
VRKLITLLLATTAHGANGQQQEAIWAEKYKDENAVVTNYKQHLEVKMEDGGMKGLMAVEKEVLLLTDIAPGLFRTENVAHNSFGKLKTVEGYSLISGKNGYSKVKVKDFKEVKSTSADIFYDDNHETILSYPALAKGAKTVLKYEIEHTDLHFMPSHYFQTFIPIIRSEFSVTVPKDVKLKWQLSGKNTNLVKQTVEEGKNKTTYTWSAENLSKYNIYDDAPSAPYYLPHLLLYIDSYKTDKDENPKRMFGTVDDLHNFYYSLIKDVNTKPNEHLKKLVMGIIKDAATEKDKARNIYEWVQKNVKYVAFEDGMGGFIPREAHMVCQRKYGDCKDMASLLVTMCKEAGLKSYYTWIGTRKKPYRYEVTPLPVVDDHMICTIELNGQYIFMDGTDPIIPFGIPPYNLQGKEALIHIDKDHYKVLNVPVMPGSDNVTVDSTKVTLSGKGLAGSVVQNIQGYGAWTLEQIMLYKNDKEKEDAIKSITARGSNKYIQKAFDFQVLPDRTVRAKSSFEIQDYVQQVGKEWYINLNLQRSYDNQWINMKERMVSQENSYKNITRQIVTLEIPKGYHVSYLPPAFEKGSNKLWKYSLRYENAGKAVRLIKEFEMNTLYIEPEQFEENNKLVEDLRKQYKESIILTAD